MAASRLEKIGTIYSRASGLIRSGAMKWEDRPLWYDVYEAFPPKEEPRYDRPVPNMTLKKIFYDEDKIRAIFHRNNRQTGPDNMLNNNYKSLTQKFIATYSRLDEQYEGKADEEKLYAETVEVLKREKAVQRPEEVESLSTAYKAAQAKMKIEVKNIFKD